MNAGKVGICVLVAVFCVQVALAVAPMLADGTRAPHHQHHHVAGHGHVAD